MKYKDYILSVIAIGGGAIASFLGEYTLSLNVLLTLMIVDFILGTISAMFNRSTKTVSGGLSSRAGWLGLMKKFTVIMFVGVGFSLDQLLDTHMIREMIIIGYSANELISIVEHAGVIGVPVPSVITKAIDILNKKADSDING